jgi:hypothetical protein
VPIAAYVDQLFLIEYTLFFGEKKNITNFYQNKLVLHRASMKAYYENELSRFDAHYIDYAQSDFATIFGKFTDVTKIVTYEPIPTPILAVRWLGGGALIRLSAKIVQSIGYFNALCSFGGSILNHPCVLVPQ